MEVKKNKWVWFKKKRVELGDGHIIAYTLFESKKHFGIIIYHWKTIRQNRFHSHAFPAYAFLLSGSYTEEVIQDGVIVQREVNNRFKRRYIPRNYIHRILKAKPQTWTIVFTGKWQPFWYEYFDSTKKWVKYTWGRKKVKEIEGDETLKILDK